MQNKRVVGGVAAGQPGIDLQPRPPPACRPLRASPKRVPTFPLSLVLSGFGAIGAVLREPGPPTSETDATESARRASSVIPKEKSIPRGEGAEVSVPYRDGT
jgi:hypothetical protein